MSRSKLILAGFAVCAAAIGVYRAGESENEPVDFVTALSNTLDPLTNPQRQHRDTSSNSQWQSELVLHGTVSADDSRLSTALIAATPQAAAQRYRIGQALPDGSVLVAIGKRSVQIGLNEEIHTLLLRSTAARTTPTTDIETTVDRTEALILSHGIWDGDEDDTAFLTPTSDDNVRPVVIETDPVISSEQRELIENLRDAD